MPPYLSVKFVPRLGPLAVSSVSKNFMALEIEWNVMESSPPYPPLAFLNLS